MDIIPAIDLLEGRCVRLFQGDYDQVQHYDVAPLALARSYQDAGMGRLHVVDLDGARTGKPVNTGIITAIADEIGMEIQAGGGIRGRDRLEALLQAGAERAVVGSMAVEDRERTVRWLGAVGPGRLVLAFDVQLDDAGEPIVLTHGWTRSSEQSLWTLVEFYMAQGARHFLCTDIARDGTLAGPNTALYRRCTERFPEAEWLASGGVSGAADLAELADTGVAGVITGKALLDGRLTLDEVRQFLRGA